MQPNLNLLTPPRLTFPQHLLVMVFDANERRRGYLYLTVETAMLCRALRGLIMFFCTYLLPFVMLNALWLTSIPWDSARPELLAFNSLALGYTAGRIYQALGI